LQRDLARFEERNAQVLGVSVDSVHSHKAFAGSLGGLGYPLLADFYPHGAVSRRYGVWQPDKGYPRRAVFIVDPAGTIRWSRFYARGLPDDEELLAALAAI
jgi:alkyl hydroperoxide reductase subunit AhpC